MTEFVINAEIDDFQETTMLRKTTAFLASTVFAITANATCPKILAAGAYSGESESTEYSYSSGIYYVINRAMTVFTISFDGKGTATTAGKMNVVFYGRKLSSVNNIGNTTPITMDYTFDGLTCVGTATGTGYDTIKFSVANSGSQIFFTVYTQAVGSIQPKFERGTGIKQ